MRRTIAAVLAAWLSASPAVEAAAASLARPRGTALPSIPALPKTAVAAPIAAHAAAAAIAVAAAPLVPAVVAVSAAAAPAPPAAPPAQAPEPAASAAAAQPVESAAASSRAMFDRARWGYAGKTDAPTTVIVSKNSFNLAGGDELFELAKSHGAMALRDRERAKVYHEGKVPIDERILNVEFHALSNPGLDYEHYIKRVPGMLARHFKAVAEKHGYSSFRKDGFTFYTIRDGLRFWMDFADPADPLLRVAAEAYLASPARLGVDFTQMLVAGITGSQNIGRFKTRVLDEERFSAGNWQALQEFATARNYVLRRGDGYALVGGGISFYLMRRLLELAKDLRSARLRRSHERVMRHLEREGVLIEYDHSKGASAFYEAENNRLAFVVPAFSGLDELNHEGTHVRFKRFVARLAASLGKRRWAVPHEIDGPGGGFLSLLNELNSWRVGEAFEKKANDTRILRILVKLYGNQAGQTAVREFAKVWTPKRVRGRAVPRLILESVRRFNAIDEAGWLAIGQRAVKRHRAGDENNFMKLLWARYYDRKPPAAALEIAEALRVGAGAEAARQSAGTYLDGRKQVSSPTFTKVQAQAYLDLSAKTEAWVEGLRSSRIAVVPAAFLTIPLYLAAEGNLPSYEVAVEAARALCGGSLVPSASADRDLFANIAILPGATFEQKATAYLRQWNARGFEALWDEFSRQPSEELLELLVQQHSGDFKKSHVMQLMEWSLRLEDGQKVEPTMAAAALNALFEELGFAPIYALEGRDQKRKAISQENLESGRRHDHGWPRIRRPRPGHWLLDAQIDEMLARKMFDGQMDDNRAELINLIMQRTYPQELPKLHARILNILTREGGNAADRALARQFLVMEENDTYPRHLAWSRSIADAIWAQKRPGPIALVYLSEYYRVGVVPLLRDPQWGRWASARLDAEMRQDAERAMSGWNREEKDAFDDAVEGLWRLSGHKYGGVRRNALYAMVSFAGFPVTLESRFLAAIEAGDKRRKDVAFQIWAMAKPGFLPKLDAYFAAHPARRTKAQRELSDIRAAAR